MIGAATRTARDEVYDLEPEICGTQQIARILHALSTSRCSMPCEALSPLANALSQHADRLGDSFRELHKMVGGTA